MLSPEKSMAYKSDMNSPYYVQDWHDLPLFRTEC